MKILLIFAGSFCYSKIYNPDKFQCNLFEIKWLVIILAFLFCIKPANSIIKELFLFFDIKTIIATNDELISAGKLIGILERVLVLTFMIMNQFEAIGFLIASKSILRYHDSNTIKTEYVLIGTMTSFAIAIFFGILIEKC